MLEFLYEWRKINGALPKFKRKELVNRRIFKTGGGIQMFIASFKKKFKGSNLKE